MKCELCGISFDLFINASMECPYCGYVKECLMCAAENTLSGGDENIMTSVNYVFDGEYLRCSKCGHIPTEYLESKLKQIVGAA